MVEESDDEWRRMGRIWLSNDGAENQIAWLEYRVAMEPPNAHPIPDYHAEATADAH